MLSSATPARSAAKLEHPRVVVVEGARRVENRDQEIRLSDTAQRAPDSDTLDLIARLADSGGVLKHERPGAQRNRFLDNVAGGSWRRGHDRAVGAEQKVEHAGLAGVGLSHNGRARAVARETPAPKAVMEQRNVVGKARDFRSDFLATWQVKPLVCEVDLSLQMGSDSNYAAAQLPYSLRQRTAKLR